MYHRNQSFKDSEDSDELDPDHYGLYGPPRRDPQQPLSLIVPQDGSQYGGGRGCLGTRGKNYMVVHADSRLCNPSTMTDHNGNVVRLDSQDILGKQGTMSFATLVLNSVKEPDTFFEQCSGYLLQFLSSSARLVYCVLGMLAAFFFFPTFCTILVVGLLLVLLYGGHHKDDGKLTTRTVKWSLTGFFYQMKDGFLASPPFLDKCGQWRMVVKQKRGIDGLQTSFGLMSTDIFPEIELVTASMKFCCTNQLGQEVNTGGMRTLQFEHEYQRPGDCGFSRPIRLSKKQLGDYEVMTIHCEVQFKKQAATFWKTLARNLRADLDGEGDDGRTTRKGKNVVTEHGTVLPGNQEFYNDGSFPAAFLPAIRFVQHVQTRTFDWEIPAFTTLLQGSELWGLYSPQFFVNSHDVCSMWRLKLLEVQGVFRLHVQLRGLPRPVKQVKLWYLIQLVNLCGDSIIPEHAICRVKYPDHLNLWDTTRHILYRRDAMLDRFLGEDGKLTLRISLQMEPNDVSLMEVDSDDWIHCPNSRAIAEQPVGRLENPTVTRRGIQLSGTPMIAN